MLFAIAVTNTLESLFILSILIDIMIFCVMSALIAFLKGLYYEAVCWEKMKNSVIVCYFCPHKFFEFPTAFFLNFLGATSPTSNHNTPTHRPHTPRQQCTYKTTLLLDISYASHMTPYKVSMVVQLNVSAERSYSSCCTAFLGSCTTHGMKILLFSWDMVFNNIICFRVWF